MLSGSFDLKKLRTSTDRKYPMYVCQHIQVRVSIKHILGIGRVVRNIDKVDDRKEGCAAPFHILFSQLY